MARFDVYRFASKAAPLVVDVQSELLNDLASRLVIPLCPLEQARAEAIDRLMPTVTVNGADYVLMTTDLAAIPRARLGERVANLDTAYRDAITNALDFLFTGF